MLAEGLDAQGREQVAEHVDRDQRRPAPIHRLGPDQLFGVGIGALPGEQHHQQHHQAEQAAEDRGHDQEGAGRILAAEIVDDQRRQVRGQDGRALGDHHPRAGELSLLP
jgi:hypothetical protein